MAEGYRELAEEALALAEEALEASAAWECTNCPGTGDCCQAQAKEI